MKNSIKTIMLAGIVSWTFSSTSFAKKESSGWMPVPEFKAYIAKKKEKKFWKSGYWITSVSGRYKDGQIEYLLRYEDAPSDSGFKQVWCYGLSTDEFMTRGGKCKKKGLERLHLQTFELPDGKIICQGVWRSQE